MVVGRPAERARSLPFEVVAVAIVFAVVSAEIVVTYSRLPAHELYHVSRSGFAGGAGRLLVFLNYPTALVAVAVLLLIAPRLRDRVWTAIAVAGVALSAAVFVPGVVDEANLDPRPVNVVAALGVGAAVLLGAVAAAHGGVERTPRRSGDRVRVAIAVAVLLLAVPWLAADLGISFDGVPILGTLYQSGELRTQPGSGALHPAVHHGHHHGMDGVLLVLSALLLSRAPPSAHRHALRAYLALMLSYGVGQIANDFWLEQVVKRGWTSWAIPDVTKPSASVAWGLIVLGAVVVYMVTARRT